MPKLKLMRPDETTNRLAEMVVYLNEQPLGCIGNNESKEFEVPAGKYRLKARIDTQGSKAYSFTIAGTQTKTFIRATDKYANTPEPWISGTWLDFIVTPLQLLYYFTIGHNRYLTISEVKWK